MKVKNCIYSYTRSKNPILHGPLEFKRLRKRKELISASHLYNYMKKDPLVDWLKLRKRRGTRMSPTYTKANGFTEFIMKRGVEFEKKIVEFIDMNKIPVVKVSDYITPESLKKTKELIFKGTPLIHSAPVQNFKNGTQGVIDLLIRSDYLSKLVDENPLSMEDSIISASKLGKPYHYVVIDIKFSTLPLRSNGVNLLNSGSFPAYKAQCLVYTEAVGLIQGFTAPHAFILGRRWKFTQKGCFKNSNSCLDKLGMISYDSIDKEFYKKTYEAINWVKDVKKHGSTWKLDPPSRLELYPNMCVDSGQWNIEKEKIADRIGEITNIWNVGVKHRNIAIEKGINNWRDKKCTTEAIKSRGVRSSVIDAIMDINRQNKDKIRPSIITNNMYDWKNKSNEIYVDFETLGDMFSNFDNLPNQSCTDMIFMIGVGWVDNGTWNYKNFICCKPTYDEEYRIMDEFANFVAERETEKIYFWAAEPRFWNTAETRQFDLAHSQNDNDKKNNICDNWKLCGWSDLCKMFRSEPIVIKDCFKFGLKSISKAMKKHNMINVNIESNCQNGMSAMINAWKTYNTVENPEKSDVMKDIAKYNEFDCKVLFEIITYLRKNHTHQES